MGKMFNTLVLSGFFSIALLLFDGGSNLGIIGQLFMGPQTSWGSFLFDALTSALGAATILGASAIVVGSFLIKMDWLVRAGLFTVLVSWVEAPFVAMWQFLGSKIVPVTIGNAGSPNYFLLFNGASTSGMIIAGFIMGPLVLYAIWACFNYIWAPESSG